MLPHLFSNKIKPNVHSICNVSEGLQLAKRTHNKDGTTFQANFHTVTVDGQQTLLVNCDTFINKNLFRNFAIKLNLEIKTPQVKTGVLFIESAKNNKFS